MSILLSICVPTYNRAAILEKSLALIFEEYKKLAADLQGKIEIILANNFSTDETDQVITKQIESANFSNVVYFTNTSNIGALRNLFALGKVSRGKYLWFLSDDDFLLPGALLNVLQKLQVGYDLVILNWRESLWLDVLGFNSSQEVYKGPELIEQFGFKLSLISCLIFDKTWFDLYFHELCDSGFPQMYTVYRGMMDQGVAYAFQTPFLIHTLENTSDFGQDSFDDYLLYGCRSIYQKLLEEGYSKELLKKFLNQLMKQYIYFYVERGYLCRLKSVRCMKYVQCWKHRSIFLWPAIFLLKFFPFLQFLRRMVKKIESMR